MKTLSEMGISPAPWHVDELNDVAKKNNGVVAFTSCWNGQSTANARILAAAPELYEALREIYENSNPMCDMECHVCKHKYGCNKWVVKARAALEKAGGKE